MFKIIYSKGSYRIKQVLDIYYSMDDLKGDTYKPELHPDILSKKIRDEEIEFEALVMNEGVFGYELEKWDPEVGQGWAHVDSCYGFIGDYDPNSNLFNHYIVDEMIGTIINDKIDGYGVNVYNEQATK